MAGKITRKFRLQNAAQFYEMFSEASPSELYFFIGKPTTWTDDNAPTTPLDVTNVVDYSIWDNMISLKRLSPSNVSFATTRNSWANNFVYTKYDSTVELDDLFHVMTDEYKVYKCLGNNRGANSTVKPTGNSNTSFVTSDGYKWKYMYSLGVADALNFLTTTYIPVSKLAADDGTDHWSVQQTAIDGGIENCTITANGSGYAQAANTFGAGANSSAATLASDASSNNNYYVGSSLYVLSGTGAGQLRSITAYDGSTKIATVSPTFTTPPSISSTYIVSPTVTITGTGSNCTAYSTIAVGGLASIAIITPGTGYTTANVAITANTGSGAVAYPNLSPKGGHGFNATYELFGHNIIMSVELSQTDANFMATNDYRIVGVLADPLDASANTASSDTYDMTTRLTIVTPTGNFLADEVITGQSTGAKGTFIEYRGVSNTTAVVLKTTAINFSNTEVITGGTSGFSANVTAVTNPGLTKYTGNILYFENRRPISRSIDQKENVKIVAKF
jgi:hypothetical protein